MKRGSWTVAEDQELLALRAVGTKWRLIAKRLGRTEVATIGRAAILKAKHPAPTPDHDLIAKAEEALEAARSMPSGPEKAEALKKAGLLRVAAEAGGMMFLKRGRP